MQSQTLSDRSTRSEHGWMNCNIYCPEMPVRNYKKNIIKRVIAMAVIYDMSHQGLIQANAVDKGCFKENLCEIQR